MLVSMVDKINDNRSDNMSVVECHHGECQNRNMM